MKKKQTNYLEEATYIHSGVTKFNGRKVKTFRTL